MMLHQEQFSPAPYANNATSEKYCFEEESLDAGFASANGGKRLVRYTCEDKQLLEEGKPMTASIRCSEMSPEMESWAIDCAAIALVNKANIKQAAAYIKKQFDGKFGPNWNCVVGSSFGSYVSHFEGCFVYFMFKDFTVLLFKI